jgi:hypothetical protein
LVGRKKYTKIFTKISKEKNINVHVVAKKKKLNNLKSFKPLTGGCPYRVVITLSTAGFRLVKPP